MRYSLVKVLLTVSPFRSSFLQLPGVHPVNERFLTPLFSITSALPFQQALCFQNHLRCPLVFFLTPNFHVFSRPARPFSLPFVVNSIPSAACALLFPLVALSRARSLCFQWLAHSLTKYRGVGVA